MNTRELIRAKILEGRTERDLTQKALGEALGKSAAAISEIERGKVQISAVDLLEVSKLLNKPIDYFYGLEKSQEYEEIVAILKRLPKKEQVYQLPVIRSLLELEEKKVSMLNKAGQDEDAVVRTAEEFYGYLVKYLRSLENLKSHVNDMRIEFEDALGISTERDKKGD